MDMLTDKMKLETNVCRTVAPYQFKNPTLLCNAETVFTGHGNVHLYVNQVCSVCNYMSIGYYTYITEPQHFECRRCKHEWSICSTPGSNSKRDNIEKALYDLDNSISKLKKIIV